MLSAATSSGLGNIRQALRPQRSREPAERSGVDSPGSVPARSAHPGLDEACSTTPSPFLVADNQQLSLAHIAVEKLVEERLANASVDVQCALPEITAEADRRSANQ
jgi:hypothetical protein